MAAGAQGKFWEMHDKLFIDTKKLAREDLDRYAGELGLDMAKFKADMDNHTHRKAIEAEQKLARDRGARGTPAFFVNGWKLSGAKPFAAFKEKIDSEIKEAEKLLKKGIAKDKVYEELTKKGLTKAPARPKKLDRAQRPRKDPKAVYKVPVGDSPSKGPADALVTIVELTDYQ